MKISVVELPSYPNDVRKLLDEYDQGEIVTCLSENPEAGVILQGTGGMRKLRWARKGRGKSGGVRIIYYYYNKSMPLYI